MSQGQKHAIEDDPRGEEKVVLSPFPSTACRPRSHVVGLDSSAFGATVHISVLTLCYGPGLLFRGPFCATHCSSNPAVAPDVARGIHVCLLCIRCEWSSRDGLSFRQKKFLTIFNEVNANQKNQDAIPWLMFVSHRRGQVRFQTSLCRICGQHDIATGFSPNTSVPPCHYTKPPYSFGVCMTVHHWYNNINNQLDATITVY